MTDKISEYVSSFKIDDFENYTEFYDFSSLMDYVYTNNNIKEIVEKLRKGYVYIKLRDVFVETSTITRYTGVDSNIQHNYYSYRHLPFVIEAHRDGVIDYNGFIYITNMLVDQFIEREMKIVSRESPYVWDDHSTALRSFNLTILFYYFLSIRAQDDKLFDKLVSLLKLHTFVLAIKSFYQANTNHGIDQMLYGYIALKLLKKIGIKYKVERDIGEYFRVQLIKSLVFSITKEYVHKENTPLYHVRHINVLIKISETLKHIDQQLVKFVQAIIGKMFHFVVYAIKPDFKYPLIGDERDVYFSNIVLKDLDDRYYLAYRKVLDARVKKSRFVDIDLPKMKVWRESGYCIYKSDWKNLDQQIYLVTKSGLLSRYHKHDDSNSFVLHGFNKDWIIDSGLYNYNYTDEFRQYMTSPYAHNIFVLSDQSFLMKDYRCGVLDYDIDEEDGEYSVKLFNEMWKGIYYEREIEIKDSEEDSDDEDTLKIEIEDTIEGIKSKYGYSLLHVPLDKEIEIKDNRYTIKGRNRTMVIEVESDNRFELNIIRGKSKLDGLISFVSYRYNNLKESYCLVTKFYNNSGDINYKYEIHFE